MKIPSFKRLFKSDFDPKDQPLIEKLANNLNYGIELIYNTLNRRITLRENISCTVKDVEVIVDGNGKPTTVTGMTLDMSSKVEGLQVISVQNLTNSNTYPTSQPFITFLQQDQSVLFNNISGLGAGNKWQIRVIAYQA